MSSDLTGTVAITDYGWYRLLRDLDGPEEVNFWKPSAAREFRAALAAPFLFKLRKPHGAICGFAFFVRYSRLPDWLAWDCFGTANGCRSLVDMRDRIRTIRTRMSFKGPLDDPVIGCVLLVSAVFFPEDRWLQPPADWPTHLQGHKKYDLTRGDGARVWQQCLGLAEELRDNEPMRDIAAAGAREVAPRFGAPQQVRPRLGQGTFRIEVMEAYERGCVVTAEHSLPALEAAHIRPYANAGPHEVSNGLFMRADLHRLFDRGYVTVTRDLRLEVSHRLKDDFENGRSYYPLHGCSIRPPIAARDQPDPAHLQWHNDNVYLG